MDKWLPRVLAVAFIGLFAAYTVSNMAGIPPAEQRPVRIPLMALAVLWVAFCIGRFFIRPKDSPVSGRPEADYDDAPPAP
jgi:hypothetical protein